jgi:hypothetical protein
MKFENINPFKRKTTEVVGNRQEQIIDAEKLRSECGDAFMAVQATGLSPTSGPIDDYLSGKDSLPDAVEKFHNRLPDFIAKRAKAQSMVLETRRKLDAFNLQVPSDLSLLTETDRGHIHLSNLWLTQAEKMLAMQETPERIASDNVIPYLRSFIANWIIMKEEEIKKREMQINNPEQMKKEEQIVAPYTAKLGAQDMVKRLQAVSEELNKLQLQMSGLVS